MPSPGQPGEQPWLPTTPGQSIAVYILTLLLMLNTTVLLLVISGELPVRVADEPGVSPPLAEAAAPERTLPERSVIVPTRQPAAQPNAYEPPASKPAPQVKPPAPVTVIRVANEPDAPQPVKPASTNEPQPEADDPPATFFGFELD